MVLILLPDYGLSGANMLRVKLVNGVIGARYRVIISFCSLKF